MNNSKILNILFLLIKQSNCGEVYNNDYINESNVATLPIKGEGGSVTSLKSFFYFSMTQALISRYYYAPHMSVSHLSVYYLN